MTSPNFEDAERELQRVEEIERNKRQDRTRAIVEAAERLAKGLDLSVMPNGAIYRTGHAKECECDHDDDLDALLVPLGQALALPSPQWTSTPPSEPGRYWVRTTDGIRIRLLVAHKHDDGAWDFSVDVWEEDIRKLEWFPARIEEPPA